MDHNPLEMNLSLLAKSALKEDFCMSAMASMVKPANHMVQPMKSLAPSGGLCSDALSNRVGSKVMNTHKPWRVQKTKNVVKSVLALSKRLSPPSLITLMKRNRPNLKFNQYGDSFECCQVPESQLGAKACQLPWSQFGFSRLLCKANSDAVSNIFVHN